MLKEVELKKSGDFFTSKPESEYSKKASIFSRLFFIWIIPLVRLGYRKQKLEKNDIKKNPVVKLTSVSESQIEEVWNKELLKPKGKRSLCCTLLKVYWKRLVWWSCITSFNDSILRVLQAPCLAILLGYFSKTGNTEIAVGIGAAAFLVLLSSLNTMCFHLSEFNFGVIGLDIRAGLSALIYKKTLKLSSTSLGEYSIGKITNIASNDLNRFVNQLIYFGSISACPLQSITVTGVLWYFFGPSSFAGVALVFLLFPIQILIGKLYGAIRFKGAAKTDLRVRLTNEVLSGIMLIKMLTWENYFAKLVANYRKEEMKFFRRKYLVDALNQSLWDVTSKLVVFVMLFCYILLGHSVTVVQAFVGLTLASYLRTSVTCYFPLGLSGAFEILTSIRRVQALLEMEEKTDESNKEKPNHEGIIIENLSGGWGKDNQEECLSNISLQASPGKLTAIVGSVGCGKSSLFYAILNELSWRTGKISYSGEISYVAQQPWLFPQTVRENILHGKIYNEVWYKQVIKACALERDFTLFPFGDMTLIGDKGISLSGGQKARVTLARAVYANADVYLLDDTLSAVDSHVGKHIFNQCIQGLLNNKTVLMATHQISLLNKVPVIYVMKGGKIVGSGDYNTVNAMNILPKVKSEESVTAEIEVEHGDTQQDFNKKIQEVANLENTPVKSQSEKEEEMGKGAVDFSLHWKYLRSGNSIIAIIIFIIANLLTQGVLSSSDLWIQLWTSQNYEAKQDNTSLNSTQNAFTSIVRLKNDTDYLMIYLYIIFGLWICSVLRNIMLYLILYRSSNAIYNNLFSTILRVPMLFFEQNPFGRILNRFTNDVGIMDERLPNLYYSTIAVTLATAAAVLLVSVIKPLMVIVTVLMAPLPYFIRRAYLKTSSSLRRLESVARSPVYGMFSSSLLGIVTIRSTKTEDKYEKDFCSLSDQQVQLYYHFLGSQKWFSATMDWLCNLYIALLLIICLVFPGDPASMALIITQAMTLSNLLASGMSQYSELDNQVVAVERILEYTNITPEIDPLNPGTEPPKDWPTAAKIEIKNLVIKYGDKPPVLRDITCTINHKEKIGVVGRTGAGKSTLLSALIRIVNPASGSIHIDGIDISKIKLSSLRSKISVIPQNPILFIGTIRENMDPFKQYSDADIWRALKEVQLEERLNRNSINGLETEIQESGDNFSQGEKQLLCLARALLLNTKILVLDEATANIDSANDALVQKVIREKFVDCTVITIAHRLDTIMDSDRILVLDSGEIMEFGEPYELLQIPDGVFRQFCENAGPANAKNLLNKAIISHDMRKKTD